jgi:hypothetical protein
MIAELATESQKNVQRSRVPSLGVIDAGGVAPPGVRVYGVSKLDSEAAVTVGTLELLASFSFSVRASAAP